MYKHCGVYTVRRPRGALELIERGEPDQRGGCPTTGLLHAQLTSFLLGKGMTKSQIPRRYGVVVLQGGKRHYTETEKESRT